MRELRRDGSESEKNKPRRNAFSSETSSLRRVPVRVLLLQRVPTRAQGCAQSGVCSGYIKNCNQTYCAARRQRVDGDGAALPTERSAHCSAHCSAYCSAYYDWCNYCYSARHSIRRPHPAHDHYRG